MRCLLIDDSEEVMHALERLLERQGVDVVAKASTADAGLRHVLAHKPDVVLLDVDLGETDGFELAKRFAAAGVDAAVIFTSAHPEYAEIPAEGTAIGFISKASLSATSIEEMLHRAGRSLD